MRTIAVAAALACAGSLAVIVLHGRAPTPKAADAAVLLSGTDFTLSGTVGNLTPGISSQLVLTATNPQASAIRLTTLTITIPKAPARCPVVNLEIGGAVFSGSPAAVRVTGLAAVVPAHSLAKVPLPILVARSAPNACQAVTFPFQYAGTATVVGAGQPTFTFLASAPNPSAVGVQVAFTATVGTQPQLTRHPPFPAGSVTFYLCTDPASLPTRSLASTCLTAVALGPAVTLDAHARARLVTTSLSGGRHPVFARFTPAGSEYAPSASTTITQLVQPLGPSSKKAARETSGARTR